MLSLPGGVILFVRHVSKRTKRGLFAGKRVLSGNNVSKDGGNRYCWYMIVVLRFCRGVERSCSRLFAEPGGCGNPMLRMPLCIARYWIEKFDLK